MNAFKAIQKENESAEIERYFAERWSTLEWKRDDDDSQIKVSPGSASMTIYSFVSRSGLRVSLRSLAKREVVWTVVVQWSKAGFEIPLGGAHNKADWETAADLAMTRAMTTFEGILEGGMDVYKNLLKAYKVL